MSYRSLLVQVDDNDQSDRRIRVAARLARAHGADLHGIYVTPAREMTPFTSAMLPNSVVENRLRETGDAQAGAEKRFRAGAAAEQLTAVTWSAPAGPALEAAILNMRRVDIGVAGQPFPEDPDAAFAGDVLYGMLMQAGRPLLIVPYLGDFPVVGRNVLIAWKETRESARAVSDALPFLKRADNVVVMPVSSPGGSVAEDAAVRVRNRGLSRSARHHRAGARRDCRRHRCRQPAAVEGIRPGNRHDRDGRLQPGQARGARSGRCDPPHSPVDDGAGADVALTRASRTANTGPELLHFRRRRVRSKLLERLPKLRTQSD